MLEGSSSDSGSSISLNLNFRRVVDNFTTDFTELFTFQPPGWGRSTSSPARGLGFVVLFTQPGGLGNEVPHPQPGALGVGGTTSPARGPACEVLFPPLLGQLWTTWRSKGKIAHTQFYEKENPEIQTKFCIY